MKKGVTNKLTVLNALENAFVQQDLQVQVQLARFEAAVELIRAIGGGYYDNCSLWKYAKTKKEFLAPGISSNVFMCSSYWVTLLGYLLAVSMYTPTMSAKWQRCQRYPVSAGVKAIYADETDLVRQGQLVVELDQSDFELRFEELKKELAVTVRKVAGMFQDVEAKQAQIILKKAQLRQAELDLGPTQATGHNRSCFGRRVWRIFKQVWLSQQRL